MRRFICAAMLLWSIGAAAQAQTALPSTRPAGTSFAFDLPKAGLTSAGIFDADGKLVRTLWTMKQLPAGDQTVNWDGLDEAGQAALAGQYSYRIILNGSTYRNVGAIGNSGQPASAFGHTPANMDSVAVDADGNIYTANGWDEAGADFKKWTPDGKSVYDAQFQIRNGKPNGAPYSIAVDEKYIYCGVGGWEREPWNARQQIQRFRLSDGKAVPFTGKNLVDGHINIYEWPGKQISAGTWEREAEVMRQPLRSLAIWKDSIYVADALGGKIRRYHKETGDPQGNFAVQFPTTLTFDSQGQLWVCHSGSTLSIFDPEGKQLFTQKAFICGGQSIAVSPDGMVLVAQQSQETCPRLVLRGKTYRKERVFGYHGMPGDRAADAFFRLKGIAFDRKGNLITIQQDVPGGARLAKWAPNPDGPRGEKFKLLWEQFGTEFVSLGNYGAADPDAFYSMSYKKYRLISPKDGTWEYAANAGGGGERYRGDPHGVVRVVRLGGNDFVYLPMGDGVQVYRAEDNKLVLAAMIGGRDPLPEGRPGRDSKVGLGQWTWADADGEHRPESSAANWFKKPGEGRYSCFGMDVDGKGNIIFANTTTRSIWEIPLLGVNERGNPRYDWAKASEIIPRDTSSLGFEPNMAQRAEDGSVYAFGWSRRWPQPKGNPFWMGGTTLARFDRNARLMWAVRLPDVCVGLDAIPGGRGGCMAGKGNGAVIFHYSADGLLIGSMKPGAAMSGETGWMDNHASVAVNRHPRDGVLDVFAEDDYVCRIGWYRVDDRDVQMIAGRIGR